MMEKIVILLIFLAFFVESQINEIDPTSDIPDVVCSSGCLNVAVDEINDGIEQNRRIFISNLFSKAKFNPKCQKIVKPQIEIIYYEPGKRIDLECKMCFKAHIYNGLPKQWKFLRQNVAENVEKLVIENRDWTVLDDVTAETFQRTSNLQRPFMPQMKNGNSEKIFLPKTQFFQRDGKLIILHPHMDAYGYYHCFDEESEKFLNHVYFLIPNTPLYTITGWNTNMGECQKDDKQYYRMDELYNFHFLPTILPPKNNFCEKFEINGDDCSNSIFNLENQPNLDDITDVYYSAHLDDEEMIKKKTNLMIYVSWSEWSSCTNFAKIRTRFGYCHVKKRDLKLKFEDDGSIQGGFPIETLHRLLENVEEFSKSGIRLFSGIMSNLLTTNGESFSHCSHYVQQYWVYLENAIFDKIASATNFTFKDEKEQYYVIDSLCFRGAYKKDDLGNIKTRVLHGQKLIQNDACP